MPVTRTSLAGGVVVAVVNIAVVQKSSGRLVIPLLLLWVPLLPVEC